MGPASEGSSISAATDRAGTGGETDVIHRRDAGEVFGDIAEFEHEDTFVPEV